MHAILVALVECRRKCVDNMVLVKGLDRYHGRLLCWPE